MAITPTDDPVGGLIAILAADLAERDRVFAAAR